MLPRVVLVLPEQLQIDIVLNLSVDRARAQSGQAKFSEAVDITLQDWTEACQWAISDAQSIKSLDMTR